MKDFLQAYKISSKNDKETFWYAVIMLLLYPVIILWALLISENSSGYYRVHNTLFILCIFCFVLVMVGKNTTIYLFSQFKQLFIKMTSYDISNYTWLIVMIVFILSIIAFLFVLDISFISNYGIRISAVAGVLLMRLLIDKRRYR